MGYKGEDLDLRTPQGVGSQIGRSTIEPAGNGTNNYHNGGAAARSDGTKTDGTIWVDEILLACCNHAFDVAFAHRSAEVRLEHLLYAITRVDAASEVLESNGIRDAGLRRESAMVIASGIPAASAAGSTRPVASAAFNEALRLASSHAANYNRAAGISDLIHVFTVLRPDLPGLDLLRRHMAGARAAQAPNFEAQAEQNSPVSSPSTTVEPGVTMTSNMTPSGMVQDNRLEAIEILMRSLGHDLALGRQPAAGAAYPYAAGGQSYATAPPQAPSQAVVASQGFSDMAPQVVNKLEQVGEHLSRLEQQLLSMEKLIKDVPETSLDLSPIDTRLNDIEIALLSQPEKTEDSLKLEESFEALRESFSQYIDQLGQNTSAQIAAVQNELAGERSAIEETGAAIGAEIKALAGASATHASSAERNLSSVREAIGEIDERFAKLESENLETRSNFVEELREVHDAVLKLNANQHTMAESITNWHKDHVSDLDAINKRLSAIEENTIKPIEELKIVSSNVTQLASNMDVMYRANIERYHRRNRFWFWLFGTDDWVGASWPSQTARIENELRALKNIRERA